MKIIKSPSLVGAVAALALTALSSVPARSNTTDLQTAASLQPHRISIIGCVRRSEPLPGTTVGTTAIPEGQTRYVLTDITLTDVTAGSASEATQSQVLSQAVTSYRLDDSADSVIAPHVGDRVRVTGMLGGGPSSPAGTTGRVDEKPATTMPTLRVESLAKLPADSGCATSRGDSAREPR